MLSRSKENCSSCIALDYCFFNTGKGRRLTSEEITAWQRYAEQIGVQKCWDRYIEKRKELGADQPGPGNRAASSAAYHWWNKDPCYNRVANLRFRIAAGPIYDQLPRIYDDVMSGQQPNTKK